MPPPKGPLCEACEEGLLMPLYDGDDSLFGYLCENGTAGDGGSGSGCNKTVTPSEFKALKAAFVAANPVTPAAATPAKPFARPSLGLSLVTPGSAPRAFGFAATGPGSGTGLTPGGARPAFGTPSTSAALRSPAARSSALAAPGLGPRSPATPASSLSPAGGSTRRAPTVRSTTPLGSPFGALGQGKRGKKGKGKGSDDDDDDDAFCDDDSSSDDNNDDDVSDDDEDDADDDEGPEEIDPLTGEVSLRPSYRANVAALAAGTLSVSRAPPMAGLSLSQSEHAGTHRKSFLAMRAVGLRWDASKASNTLGINRNAIKYRVPLGTGAFVPFTPPGAYIPPPPPPPLLQPDKGLGAPAASAVVIPADFKPLVVWEPDAADVAACEGVTLSSIEVPPRVAHWLRPHQVRSYKLKQRYFDQTIMSWFET